jgi:hypothetical protein
MGLASMGRAAAHSLRLVAGCAGPQSRLMPELLHATEVIFPGLGSTIWTTFDDFKQRGVRLQ